MRRQNSIKAIQRRISEAEIQMAGSPDGAPLRATERPQVRDESVVARMGRLTARRTNGILHVATGGFITEGEAEALMMSSALLLDKLEVRERASKQRVAAAKQKRTSPKELHFKVLWPSYRVRDDEDGDYMRHGWLKDIAERVGITAKTASHYAELYLPQHLFLIKARRRKK